MPDPSVVRFRSAVASACAELERRRTEVNDLNVFPVADGDTGDNMVMTMRSVLEELDRLNGQTLDAVGRDEVVHAVARAALFGARGNSGVILSQIVRGAAEELVSRPGELVDPVLVSAAFARAADAAYASVREPAEGTMLSAVRAMAHRVARELAHMETPRLGPEADPADQDALLAQLLEHALEAGEEAVRRGPEQLAVLRDAGVVDAGAYGVTVILAGVLAALRGSAGAAALEHQTPSSAAPHLPEHGSSRFRYCTNFVVTGRGLAPRDFVPRLEELGDSVLVVGDERTLRVHLHTDDPQPAAAIFEQVGRLSRFDVADMREQTASRARRLSRSDGRRADSQDRPDGAPATCGVVAVASGSGIVAMYEELGALVVEAGATLNPSTYDLLAGIHSLGADEALVLPNGPNVFMAAERAAELSEKKVHVVPTSAQQVGLAAMLAFVPTRSARENAEALGQVSAAIRTGGVAQAVRDDPAGRFRAGEAVGYAGDELVAWGQPAETLAATIARIARAGEIVTCIAGEGAPLDRAAVEATMPEQTELDHHVGGQTAWWWLLAVE